MARFKRLTDAEARTLTRAELLDRVEAEQAYWSGKHTMTGSDAAAEREFSRILRAYLSPQAAIEAAMGTVQGRRSDYWETRPCDDQAGEPSALVLDESQQVALAYGLRRAEQMEAGQ